MSTAYESADLTDDVIDVLKGEHNAAFRMVTSYWESQLRARFESKFDEKQAGHLERAIMQLPHAKERLDERVNRRSPARRQSPGTLPPCRPLRFATAM